MNVCIRPVLLKLFWYNEHFLENSFHAEAAPFANFNGKDDLNVIYNSNLNLMFNMYLQKKNS